MSVLDKRKPLTEKLKILSSKLRMVFAVDCAYRALSKYREWSKQEGKNWGNPDRLLDTINLLWHAIEKNDVPASTLEREKEQVYALIPDTEEFPDASGNGALDAAIAVAEALKCVAKNGDVESAIFAGESALFSSDVVLGQGVKFQNITSDQILSEAEEDSEMVEKEWSQQLKTLDILLKWGDNKITRMNFYEIMR